MPTRSDIPTGNDASLERGTVVRMTQMVGYHTVFGFPSS